MEDKQHQWRHLEDKSNITTVWRRRAVFQKQSLHGSGWVGLLSEWGDQPLLSAAIHSSGNMSSCIPIQLQG